MSRSGLFIHMRGEAVAAVAGAGVGWGGCGLNERRDETRERAGTRQSKQTLSAEEERGSR